MNFKVIVTAYNCPTKIEACLRSIADQDHTSFDVCVVDDASEDPTQAQVIRDFTKEFGWCAILNQKRKGAMFNHVMAIKSVCKDPDDVIVFVDGDDKLAHNGVLSHLDSVYSSDEEIDLTYGSYEPVPASRTCPAAQEYPKSVIERRSYRSAAFLFNHLRTLKYRLFQQMDEEVDFKNANGEWLMTSTDSAMMIPGLELARKHAFIPEILYHYTSNNPISDWRVDPRLVDMDHRHIQHIRSYVELP